MRLSWAATRCLETAKPAFCFGDDVTLCMFDKAVYGYEYTYVYVKEYVYMKEYKYVYVYEYVKEGLQET